MNRFRQIIRPEQLRELSLLLIILITLIVFASQINNYFSVRTFYRISSAVAIITVVAVGQTLVVLARQIDLSVGSVVGFTAFFVGQQLALHDLSPIFAVLIALAVGAAFGLVNGLLVAYGRVPAIVVTLGTLAIYRGLLFQYSNNDHINVHELPEWIVDLPRTTLVSIGGVEVRLMMVIALAVVVIFQLVVLFLPFGRRLYALGSNPEAAHMAGIPSQRIVLLAFVLCGALAGLGGFMFLARFGTITTVAAGGLELQVVAAVVVGGVNIFGGSGTIFGAMLGAILIGTLEQSLIRMRINEFWKDALLGLFILMAIASDAVILNRIRDFWARTDLTLKAEDAPDRGLE